MWTNSLPPRQTCFGWAVGPVYFPLLRIFPSNAFGVTAATLKKIMVKQSTFSTNLFLSPVAKLTSSPVQCFIPTPGGSHFEYKTILHQVPADFQWGQKHSFAPTASSQWGQFAPTAQRWHRPWVRNATYVCRFGAKKNDLYRQTPFLFFPWNSN